MKYRRYEAYAEISIAMHRYESLRLALVGAGVSQDSAELHGSVCAGLCVGGPSAADALTAAWLGDGDSDVETAREIVHDIEQESWQAMSGGAFDLELMLPDDEAEIAERVAALAAWCHGFISGLGVAGLSLTEHAPSVRAELEEIIGDFGEISQASTDVEDIVEGGFQLASIVEFVRAGVQIVFESLSDQRDSRIAGPLH